MYNVFYRLLSTVQVVETSVTVNNNSPIQDYVHSDDQTQPVESLQLFTRRAMPVKAMTEQKQEIIKKVVLDIYLCPNNDINKLR